MKQIKLPETKSKATTLFLKLYPKWKGKKSWDSLNDITYPEKPVAK